MEQDALAPQGKTANDMSAAAPETITQAVEQASERVSNFVCEVGSKLCESIKADTGHAGQCHMVDVKAWLGKRD